MTGYILKPYGDRVEIATDGAAYDHEGTITDIRYKVCTSDCIPLAIAGSGPVKFCEIIAEYIIKAAAATGSVDETIALLGGALSQIKPPFTFDSPVRIAIGCISETRGPTTYVFATFEEAGGLEPFVLTEQPTGFGQGALPSGEDMLRIGVTGRDLGHDAPILFDYMRRQKMVNPVKPEKEPFYSIGGRLDLTIIRPTGYEQTLLKTWPDVIGEKIDPFRDQAAAA